MKYLYENNVNGYILDNQLRSSDPHFKDQKEKYGKCYQILGKPEAKEIIPASDFQPDPIEMSCRCLAGTMLSH